MNVNYSPKAIADLRAIHAFVSQDSPRAADAVVARIMQSIAMLAEFPLAGRVGRISATRELPIVRLPYFAIYRIGSETELFVLSVIHTSRQWPSEDA